jgi:hypothetical protein
VDEEIVTGIFLKNICDKQKERKNYCYRIVFAVFLTLLVIVKDVTSSLGSQNVQK